MQDAPPLLQTPKMAENPKHSPHRIQTFFSLMPGALSLLFLTPYGSVHIRIDAWGKISPPLHGGTQKTDETYASFVLLSAVFFAACLLQRRRLSRWFSRGPDPPRRSLIFLVSLQSLPHYSLSLIFWSSGDISRIPLPCGRREESLLSGARVMPYTSLWHGRRNAGMRSRRSRLACAHE